MIDIDGSILEGGGQILRIALVCSALTRKPIRVHKIRAGRQKGGLAAQHLKGLELMRDLCSAKVNGASLGSTEIEFVPGKVRGGVYVADTKTAGSVALLLQVALPAALFANAAVSLELKGGTNADMAPQIDFMTEIFRPNLQKFGASFELDIVKRGYFPKGGGFCRVNINPVANLMATDITEFGEIERFFGWSYAAGTLPIKVAHELSDGSKNTIKQFNLHKTINIEIYKEDPKVAIGNSSGIILGCRTSNGCILGGSALSSRKESNFEAGSRAAKEVTTAVKAKACVDEHIQDQLIVFMALASGRSRVRTTKPLTLHTSTAIHMVQLLTMAKFEVIEEDSTCIIQCDGIALQNNFD